MTVSVLKRYIKKKAPITINYRCYKNFNETIFRNDLISKLGKFHNEIISYDCFNSNFMEVLDKHAPSKTKVIRGNNAPFMNKSLSKAFMHRSKLKNRFNKDSTDINRRLYKKQRIPLRKLTKKGEEEIL